MIRAVGLFLAPLLCAAAALASDTSGPDAMSDQDASAQDPSPEASGAGAAGALPSVHVTVVQIPFALGNIRAALCEREQFRRSGCTGRREPAKGAAVTVVLENIRPGTYGVQVHHDENGNGEMDFGLLGIPKEGFGFSRDAKPGFGPPDFDEVKFEVAGEDVYLTVTLQHVGRPKRPKELEENG